MTNRIEGTSAFIPTNENENKEYTLSVTPEYYKQFMVTISTLALILSF
jgi:hypothetical protein